MRWALRRRREEPRTEDMFGLTHLGAADGRRVKPFASTTLLREGTGD